MLFVEFRFFVFFLIVFCVYWGLQSNRNRKIWLWICSYFFYGCWDWRFLFLIMASTTMDYTVGLMLSKTENPVGRKAWLWGSIAANVSLIGFFKYYNFFVTSAADFSAWLGMPVSLHTLNIILPVGVSFFTFQSMSYTIDVYRKHIEPVRNPLDLAFFISFFPQLVAGPIVRASTFLPQVYEKKNFANVDVRAALILFMVGFIKKACVAESVAPYVDKYFNAPETYTALSGCIAIVFYAIQIYCDFSGYTDMAIASARLLGYELTINFYFPYFAHNITEFWRRWHISLSTWLRDYLYIPLGGNRGTKIFTYRNLMLTMLIGGLWHGANWTFVLWGALHGAALIVHREWVRLFNNKPLAGKIVHIAGVALTFYFVCICWTFFRATNFTDALTGLKAFVLFQSDGTKIINPALLWLFVGLAIAHWIAYKQYLREWWRRGPDWCFAAGYGATAAFILLFVPTQYAPFIYFQF